MHSCMPGLVFTAVKIVIPDAMHHFQRACLSAPVQVEPVSVTPRPRRMIQRRTVSWLFTSEERRFCLACGLLDSMRPQSNQRQLTRLQIVNDKYIINQGYIGETPIWASPIRTSCLFNPHLQG